KGPTPVLFHFHDSAWEQCAATMCGKPNAFLTITRFGGADALPRLAVAGSRVYLTATAGMASTGQAGLNQGSQTAFPLILHKDPGGDWTQDHYPGDNQTDTSNQGVVRSISVVKTADGYSGWVTGRFGRSAVDAALRNVQTN